MNAVGQHVLIRKPKKQDAQGLIQLPESFGIKYAYGRVVTIGELAAPLIGNVKGDGESLPLEEGQIVVFDHFGAREIELDGKKDANLVVAHASQLYCTITEAELEARKLPIP